MKNERSGMTIIKTFKRFLRVAEKRLSETKLNKFLSTSGLISKRFNQTSEFCSIARKKYTTWTTLY